MKLVDEKTWIHLRMERILEVIEEMKSEGYCSDHMRPLEDEFTFLRGRMSMITEPSVSVHKQCIEIADKVVPNYRMTGSYSCTGHYAKRWQAAYDGANLAITGKMPG